MYYLASSLWISSLDSDCSHCDESRWQDCRHFWSTYLDSHNVFVCTNIITRFSVQTIHRLRRSDFRKLVTASVTTKCQTELGSRLAISSPRSTDGHWLHLRDAMKMTGEFACGFTKRAAYEDWVSTSLWWLGRALRCTSGNCKFDGIPRSLRYEIAYGFLKEWESWILLTIWKKQPTSDNFQQLLQLMWVTRCTKSDVSEAKCRICGISFKSIYRRLGSRSSSASLPHRQLLSDISVHRYGI